MHKNILIAVGITFLFLGTCITPSVAIDNVRNASIPISDKTVITVDDEGDGDYTSIKDALSFANPGDTIEVYSGTYLEQVIRIIKDNITLLGIPHELGGGNDTGKPIIIGDGTTYVVKLIESNITVSNFIIENSWTNISYKFACIWVGTEWPDELEWINISDLMISNCIIRNSSSGILVAHGGITNNITIINNYISDCYNYGIYVSLVYNPVFYAHKGSCIISGNVITDCLKMGIWMNGELQNVSGNMIKRCGCGIRLEGDYNIIYGNDIESCSVGICDADFLAFENIITKNNFKNYSRSGYWWGKLFGFINMILNIFRKKGWIENYWDTWIGIGPKIIPGVLPFNEYYIPWFIFDRRPAKEPYDIEV
ncbi:MAG: right-handed parallel beta-helix repeat-containing protein [Thermoplasmatales archaeon]|nr:MAG: right-handed parallel beta-helix repeat-containing protein [Thermoplasmatales archaeon]